MNKILEYNKWAKTSGGVEKRLVADPIQPIVDIIHSSIMKYDLETTRVGLKAVTDQVINVIDLKYLFSWGNVPGNDSKKLKRFLRDDFDIDWAKNAKISKLGKTISISKDINSAEIVINEKEKKATFNDGQSHDLEVRKEYGKLNIYIEISAEDEIKISENFCDHLTRVGRLAVSREDEESTRVVTENLENFGREEKKLAVPMQLAARTLVKVGKAAVEKGLGDATKRAAGSLAELTNLSKDNVETAICNYESKLKGQDDDSFNEFIKIYKQELEKLRAEK